MGRFVHRLAMAGTRSGVRVASAPMWFSSWVLDRHVSKPRSQSPTPPPTRDGSWSWRRAPAMITLFLTAQATDDRGLSRCRRAASRPGPICPLQWLISGYALTLRAGADHRRAAGMISAGKQSAAASAPRIFSVTSALTASRPVNADSVSSSRSIAQGLVPPAPPQVPGFVQEPVPAPTTAGPGCSQG